MTGLACGPGSPAATGEAPPSSTSTRPAAQAGTSAEASGASTVERDTGPHVRFSVHRVPAPDGQLGVAGAFALDPGWHIYWRHPGDAGLATRLEVPGAQNIAYPPPERFVSPGDIESFGYGEDTALFAEVPMPKAGPLRVEASWLACRERCIKGRAEAELPLDAPSTSRFEALRGELPLPLEREDLRHQWEGDTLELTLSDGTIREFFPAQVDPMIFEGREASARGSSSSILRWRRAGAIRPQGPQGLLIVESEGQQRAYTLDLPWPEA